MAHYWAVLTIEPSVASSFCSRDWEAAVLVCGMDRSQYVQLDTPKSDNKNRGWLWYIVSFITVPLFLYVFIVLPMSSPEQVPLAPLKKYERMSPRGHERLVLIGDVHGCFDSLQSLLSTLDYDEQRDVIVLMGDFLSKGPDSKRVMTWVRDNNITGVLGNHEMNILSKYQNFKPLIFDDEDVFTLNKHIDRFDQELQIARKLTPQEIAYLNSLPFVLEIDGVGVCTHMGLIEASPLQTQPVQEMLKIDRDWYHSWDKLQRSLSKKDRTVVFYGHHASVGLNLKKYSKGLDSGCVYGGQLSALVIDKYQVETLYQVECS